MGGTAAAHVARADGESLRGNTPRSQGSDATGFLPGTGEYGDAARDCSKWV